MIIETALLLSFDLKSHVLKEMKQDISTHSVYDRFYSAEQKIILDPEKVELFQKLFEELNRPKFDFK